MQSFPHKAKSIYLFHTYICSYIYCRTLQDLWAVYVWTWSIVHAWTISLSINKCFIGFWIVCPCSPWPFRFAVQSCFSLQGVSAWGKFELVIQRERHGGCGVCKRGKTGRRFACIMSKRSPCCLLERGSRGTCPGSSSRTALRSAYQREEPNSPKSTQTSGESMRSWRIWGQMFLLPHFQTWFSYKLTWTTVGLCRTETRSWGTAISLSNGHE